MQETEVPGLSFEMPGDALDSKESKEVSLEKAQQASRDALRAAADRRKPIDRAAGWAHFSAWGLVVMGVLSLPGMFGSLGSFLLVVGLGVTATLEFRGRAALRRLEPAGATLLARNQLLLGAVIGVYCALNVLASLRGEGRYDQILESTPELENVLGGMSAMIQQLMIFFYGVVAVVGVGFQLLSWRFHNARVAMVETHLALTPAWVLEDTAPLKKNVA